MQLRGVFVSSLVAGLLIFAPDSQAQQTPAEIDPSWPLATRGPSRRVDVTPQVRQQAPPSTPAQEAGDWPMASRGPTERVPEETAAPAPRATRLPTTVVTQPATSGADRATAGSSSRSSSGTPRPVVTRARKSKR